MEKGDGGYDVYSVAIPLPEGSIGEYRGGIRLQARRHSEGPVVTLLLRRRDTGGVFSRASYHPGDDKGEAAARKFLQQQDAGWWYRARWMIGDGLEIVEA